MRIAAYFHEMDDWCPGEAYPIMVQRLETPQAEKLMRDGFVCSAMFEARAVILGQAPSEVVPARCIEDGDELLLMHTHSPTAGQQKRDWWLVSRIARVSP